MNDEWSQVAANGVIHAADQAFAAFTWAAADMSRPSVLYKPALTADGTMWCALLGDNLQEGIAGFGETPDKAMRAFDEAFLNARTPVAVRLARAPQLQE